jgi:hypothetical protein
VRKVREGAMLLLLYRPIRNAMTFCTFKKIKEWTPAEKRHEEQHMVCKNYKLICAKLVLKFGKEILICTFYINKNLTDCSYTGRLLHCLD